MKLRFDQNPSFKLCDKLADLYPESTQTGALGLASAADRTVWEAAQKGSFALVTQDADFAEMAALFGPPPKVIWLRCGTRPTSFLADLLPQRAPAISVFEADERAACLEIY